VCIAFESLVINKLDLNQETRFTIIVFLSTDNFENFSGKSESPGSEDSPPKVSKKDKKKEKKEKKKKKEKKEKKEKRKKKKSKVSESEGEEEEENHPEPEVVADEGEKTGNSSDEELWGFFENMNKNPTSADILMDKMKKKNEARLKRIKEIEEDRRKHQ
jgi:outer membrane biosynthesis protein TonB